MRIIPVIFFLLFAVSVSGQTVLQDSYSNHLQRQSLPNSSSLKDSTIKISKKWFVSKYAGMSTSFGFFNGGNATVFAVPVGIQLNRRLNDNWYAFAGVSAAPAYTNFNRSFISANTGKFGQGRSMLTTNRFDLYSRAELGLMYVNDQKTFSISGSIGIERSNYPLMPFNQLGASNRNTFFVPNK